jgi:nucleoside-diphosphate-sugar epimerase
MARVLIVGCGCRGRALAAGPAERGLAVRGTTREPERVEEIVAAGAEAVIADPDRLGTLLPHVDGVTVVCWLMGSAEGEVTSLHSDRLQSLLEKLVDTPVRGFVYEAAGSVHEPLLDAGGAIARAAGATFRMPVAVVEEPPGHHGKWLAAMMSAVDRLLVP